MAAYYDVSRLAQTVLRLGGAANGKVVPLATVAAVDSDWHAKR